MQILSNKVALVTGAARGIGMATAQRFLKEGACVMLADMDTAGLREAERNLGKELSEGKVAFVAADVSDAIQVIGMVDKTMETFGRLDVVFCNAGIGGHSYFFWEYPDNDFDAVSQVNLRGVFLTMKYAMPALIKSGGGSIILTSSVAGLGAMPKGIAYSATKHALVGLARTAALEAARYGVRVNTIHPGPIETEMVRMLEKGLKPNDPDQGKLMLERGIPMRRYGTPEEVASLVLFLASDESRYITGSEHRIDGGMMSS